MTPEGLGAFISFADSITLVGLLLLIVYGSVKGHWYSGESYRQIKNERDELLRVIFLITQIQKSSIETQKNIVQIVEEKITKDK